MLQCQYCSRQFKNVNGLGSHIRVHNKVKPYETTTKTIPATSTEFPLFSLMNGDAHFRFAETPFGYVIIEHEQIRIILNGNLSEILKYKKEESKEENKETY